MSDRKEPKNLIPYIYKCGNCGSMLKYLKDTDSYYLMRVPAKGIKNCKFCYSLSQNSISEVIGLKVVK